jgi:hypothetical protein
MAVQILQQDYSLFLSFAGTRVSETLCEWVVVDLQLRDLKRREKECRHKLQQNNLLLDKNAYFSSPTFLILAHYLYFKNTGKAFLYILWLLCECYPLFCVL